MKASSINDLCKATNQPVKEATLIIRKSHYVLVVLYTFLFHVILIVTLIRSYDLHCMWENKLKALPTHSFGF